MSIRYIRADSVCIHSTYIYNAYTHAFAREHTDKNSYATLLSNTSLHNMYFRLLFLLFYICIQRVTFFPLSLSLSLVHYYLSLIT